jgi:hypothetical protein
MRGSSIPGELVWQSVASVRTPRLAGRFAPDSAPRVTWEHVKGVGVNWKASRDMTSENDQEAKDASMMGLGAEALLTILLPGAMLTAFAAMLICRLAPDAYDAKLVQTVVDREWMATLVIVLSSALLGSLMAVLVTIIEENVLDYRSARSLRIDDDEYGRQWSVYVRDKELLSNAFICKLAMNYQIQMRLGISGFLATMGVAFVTSSRELWTISLICSALFTLLSVAGMSSHKGLAEYRRDFCASNPPKPEIELNKSARDAPWRWALLAMLTWLLMSYALSPAW